MQAPSSSLRSRSTAAVLFLATLGAPAGVARAQAPAESEPAPDAAPAMTEPTPDAAPATLDAAAPAPADAPVVPAAPAEPSVRVRASLETGFGVDSADGRFGVQLGALVQYRFRADTDARRRWHPYFNTYNVRPQIRMHAFGEQLRLFIQPEIAGEAARLLDLEITYRPHEAFQLKLGQFLTPFSRAFYTPVPVMQFANFGPANDVFRMNRDTGAMVYGTPMRGKLEYYLGAFNGNAINRRTSDPVRWMGVARLVYAPLGAVPYDGTLQIRPNRPWRFAIAVNGYAGRLRSTRHAVDPTTGANVVIVEPERRFQAGGADFVVNGPRLHLTGEVYYRHDRIDAHGAVPVSGHASLGAQLQAGWYVPQARLELVARTAYVDLRLADRGTSMASYEAGVNYYVAGNNAKLRLTYQRSNASDHALDDLGAAVTLRSLGYVVGKQDRILLDTQVFF